MLHFDGGSRSRNKELALFALHEMQPIPDPGIDRTIRQPTLNKNRKKHRKPPHIDQEKIKVFSFVYPKGILRNVYSSVKLHIVRNLYF